MKPTPWKVYKIRGETNLYRCCGKLSEDDSGTIYPFIEYDDGSSYIDHYYIQYYFKSKDIIKEVCIEKSEKNPIWEALEDSVKLQSHYASLLNMYDSGKRLTFANADEWLKRLKKLKKSS